MKKTLLLLFALIMSVGFSAAFAQSPVIMDFSGLPDNSNKATQQGWNVTGIMDEIAAAKYLIIETEGTGDNPDGFGGLHFIYQGNNEDNSIVVSWTDDGVDGNYEAYPRADGKTVSIAIDIKNTMGTDNYNNFLQCTGWARFLLGYYGGNSAFEGLGVTNAYLTTDFDKPAGAVDLSGGTNIGFIFDGSVTDIQTGTGTTPTSILDFESDAIETTYPSVAWNASDITAVVAENPAPKTDINGDGIINAQDFTESDQHALHITATNYNAYPKFHIVLPEGIKVSDIEQISLAIYFNGNASGQNDFKNMDYFVGAHGTSFTPNASTGSAGNLIGGSEATDVWLSKSFPFDQTNISADVLDLNEFDFAMGISNSACDYYLDNVTLTFNNQTGIVQVKPVLSNAYGVTGGVVVNAVNEKVSVYGIDGRLLKQTIVTGNNTSLSLLQGIYIVKVGDAQPVKVIVR